MDEDVKEAADDDASPKRERVFVVWDSKIDGMKNVLIELRDDPPDGFDVDALGLTTGAGTIWDGNVKPGIRRAANILAIVNKPNANVGHEIGYALGQGKGLRLVAWTERERAPKWVSRPPFTTQLVPTTSDIDGLCGLVVERKWVTLSERPTAGDATLLLCPRKGEGSAIRRRIARTTDWQELDEHGWTLDDLPKRLSGFKRVIWIVMPFLEDDEGHEERDGQENAAMATVAGFASSVGLKVHVWQNKRAREVLDVGHVAYPWESVEDLQKLMAPLVKPVPRATAPQPRTVEALLADYRASVHRVHSSLVPFFAGTSNKLLSEIFVELSIVADGPMLEGKRRDGKSRWSLRELLADERGSRRYVVLGDPGAGKSTVCRHLAYELTRGDDATLPVPIFVSLARLSEATGDLFDLAEADLRITAGEADSRGLAVALRERARSGSGGAVWLLLDGLDEVPTTRTAKLRTDLVTLLSGLANVAVVVTSRSIGYQALGSRFEEAKLLELEPTEGRKLLTNWIGVEADRVWRDIESFTLLAEMARNPLMLTLIAKLAMEGEPLPRTRGRLYEQATDVLLRRGAGMEPKGVDDPDTTAHLLATLSLRLHQEEGECWPKPRITDLLFNECKENDDFKLRLEMTYGTPEKFLAAVSVETGILGPLHGVGEPWRYLHRSLREFLTARALLAVEDRTPFIDGAKQNVSHWGETFALLTGMVPVDQRLGMLESLREANNELALRALPHVEGIEPRALFEFLAKVDDWSGDNLSTLVKTWLQEGVPASQVQDVLWSWIAKERSTEELAYLYYAMEQNDLPVDREAFFRKCDRWPKTGFPEIETVDLPPEGESSEFWMGSPDKVGQHDERPRHRVKLSPFRLGVTTVTEGVYALFDDRDPESKKRVDDPVVVVNWWESWLFARWIGGSLPTEAQWEYACRARSDAQWCFGDDKTKLKDYAWFGEGVSGSPHPVQKKEKNDFGLFDMHGNVWEWCADWRAPYPAELADSSAKAVEDPIGPAAGSIRVRRGGSFWNDAVWTRSAYRVGDGPGNRDRFYGFRVAFPARAAGPPDLGDR